MSTAIQQVRQFLGTGLGASEVASAIGISRWKPRISLWLEKTGQAANTVGEPAEWGKKLEPVIRGEYVERHGVEVHTPQQSAYHPSITWARATVDGEVYVLAQRSHVLECKTVGLRLADDWGDEDAEEIPDYYVVQGVWQMFVTGLRRVDFAVLLGGQRYFERTLHHDPDLEAAVFESADEFWRLVESRTAPSADDSDQHSRYLRSKIKPGQIEVPAPPDVDELAVRWRETVQATKRLTLDEKLIKNQILERAVALGASKLKTTVGKIGVSTPGVERDWKALATDLCNRLQLRGEPVSLDAEIERFTTASEADGSLRRPTGWTKGIK